MALKHALVVDDSKSARVMLSRLLEKNKLTVDMVDSADNCFDFLKKQRPDVIFMDHMMPEMDGLEATQVLAKDAQTASIPVVMYTSKEGDEYMQQAREHGAFAILPKPAKQPMITEILDKLQAAEQQAPAAPASEPEEEAAPAQTGSPADANQAPAEPEVDMAEVERIAQQTAETVLQKNLDSQLSEALESRLASFREEVQDIGERAAQQALNQLREQEGASVDTRIQQANESLRSELTREIEQKARSAVVEALEKERSTLAEETQNAVDRRFADLEAQLKPDSLTESLKEEVRSLASSCAQEEARKTANEVAHQRVSGFGDKVSQEMFYSYARQMQASLRKTQVLAGLSGIIGGLAIALVIFGVGPL